MKKKISSGFLALVFLLQAFLPSLAYANQATPPDTKIISEDSKGSDNVITIGKLKGVGFSQDNPTASISMEEVKEKNHKKTDALDGLEIGDEIVPQALRSSGSPYIKGQQPADPDKPKYWANVKGTLTTRGIDGTTFDWNKVLGQGAKVKLLFTQTNGNVMTGVRFYLEVDKDGTYTWSNNDGNPTYLPLYDVDGNPYTYNVQIERNFSENVQLIIQESNGTPKSQWREEGDKQVATISFLDISIQQVASTKFVSEWHTAVDEADRPQIEGYFKVDDETDNDFNFPKNDTTRTILRSSFVENFVEDEDNGPWSFLSSELETTPETVEVKTNTPGLTFEETDGVKTVTSGDHKFKYDFNYDVINGGKLTMTEILPVTFDANGGKFDSITDPDAEQKIVKEVEYDKNLTEKAEAPTKDRETFKGWSTTQDGKTPATDTDFANITEAKTFYAIWESKAFNSEGLTVYESFKDDKGNYVNDFIPTLKQLKEKVKVDGEALTDEDKLAILGDDGQPLAGEAAIKDYLYTKLGEEDDNKNDRTVEIKGQVTDTAGKTHEVIIPIKVMKNIYEAKTEEGRPIYVPDNYLKVTLDPTTKAKEPQKYFYYVNPKAKVVIPGENPVGTPGNNFINWTIPGAGADPVEYKLTERPRHQFDAETTITANYVGNIVEQKTEDKPKVPDDFVKVTVDTTDNATNETKFTKTFWVKKDTPVRIDVQDPVAKDGAEAFSKWRQEKDTNRFDVIDLKVNQTFTKPETLIRAFYSRLAIPEPKQGKPSTVPDNFIKVIFDPTDKAKDKQKIVWWVAPDKEAVRFAITSPVGKAVQDDDGKTLYTWKFDTWETKGGKLTVEGSNSYTLNTKEVTDGEVFKAQYTTDNIIPYDPANPMDRPEGYVNVTFKSETGLSLKDAKAYYVKKNALITLKTIKDDKNKGYPTVEEKAGYAFDKWDPADTTEIKDKDIVVIAKAKPVSDVMEKKEGKTKPQGYVEVTFVPTDKATDETEKTFWVNPEKEVTIPVKDPLGKTYYTFKGWKIGDVTTGEDYSPTTLKKFTENTTITATYEETPSIIPYDPTDPITKPEGYVRVSFEAEEGINLSNVKAYYVKKNANITLGNSKLVKPITTAMTGYEFKEWDKKDDTVIGNDVVVKALAKTILDAIEKKEGVDKPKDYVEVTFKADGSGNGTVTEKTYFVNPNKYVQLTPPDDAKGKTGYEFGAWSENLSNYKQYTKDTVITASFNPIASVIPKTKENDSEKPAGYVKVDFIIKGEGGKIPDKETTTYFVNPEKDVTIQPPKTVADTGYVFEEWDQDTTKTAKYTEDITVKGSFKKLGDIIPSTNDQGKQNPKPEGYVTVTFEKGPNGKTITGQTVYYVNPQAGKTLADITKPEVEAETGYKFTTWNMEDSFKITEDKRVIAKYEELKDVIPQKNTDQSDKPAGYATVTFLPGAHGKLTGQTVFYINPNKSVRLESHAPRVTADTDYTFTGWDASIHWPIQYRDGDKITALYRGKEESGGSWQTGTLGPTRTRTVTVVEKEIVKVPAEKTFRKEVRYMQGYNNYFRPGAGLTRAEAAQILANALVEDGYRYDPNFAIHYKDIVGNEWYAKAIRITSQANVFKGYDTGYFDPHKKITRAEWIGTLRRFQELERVSGNHMQVRADHWAMGEIEAAYKEGWLAIYGQGLAKFKADEFIPRQEVAAVSNKAFNRVLDKTYIHRNSKNLINYKDVNPSLWSYEDILCASNGFIHDGKSFWGHKVDYKKDLYNINLDGYTVTKDKFQRLERR